MAFLSPWLRLGTTGVKIRIRDEPDHTGTARFGCVCCHELGTPARAQLGGLGVPPAGRAAENFLIFVSKIQFFPLRNPLFGRPARAAGGSGGPPQQPAQRGENFDFGVEIYDFSLPDTPPSTVVRSPRATTFAPRCSHQAVFSTL